MTLIASFLINNHPFIIGDLLLSSEFISKEKINSFKVPTSREPNQSISTNIWNTNCGLSQKVIVISNNLALAWAGNMYDAKNIIKNICIELKNSELTMPQFINFLDSQKAIVNDVVCITGFFLDSNSGVTCNFGWSSDLGFEEANFKNALLGPVFMFGTGESVFKTVADNLSNAVITMPDGNTLEEAIGMSLTMIGELTGRQMRTGEGLSSFYGGGYELIMFENGKFKKVNNVAHCLLEVRLDESDKLSISPKAVLKYEYDEDLLLVRKFTMFSIGTEENEIFVIQQPHIKVCKDRISHIMDNIPELQLSGLFNNFYIYLPEKKNFSTIYYYVGGSGTLPITYSYEKEDQVCMTFSSEFIDRLIKVAS